MRSAAHTNRRQDFLHMGMLLGVLLLTACSGGVEEGAESSQVSSPSRVSTRPQGLASENKVLILSTTVSGGTSSDEAVAARQLGYTVQLVTENQWRALSSADFASYRAIILGDRNCSMAPGLLKTPVDTAATWGPVIDGNVIVMGTDPVFHRKMPVTFNAVKFAAATQGKTGMYVGLSCYYHGVDPATSVPVPVLAPFGEFSVTGVGCYNDAHIVASHDALSGLTDEDLSNWKCSVHEAFVAYPESNFTPLVIARDSDSEPRWPGSRDFADGSHGVPYVLARGAIPVRCGDGVVQAPEQCDSGAQNGVPGSACSSVCRLHWCGDGVVDPGEECDTGAQNGSGTCSASCRGVAGANQPPVARCRDLHLSALSFCGATGSVDDGSSDPEGHLAGCTQSPSNSFGLGDHAVTLTCTDAEGLSASCTARVTVTDTTAPSIYCASEATAECTGLYTPVTLADASVSDVCEFSHQRTPVNPSFLVGGPYAVNHDATDSSGNSARCVTQVTVVDTTAPAVALVGESSMSLACGTSFTDPGARATDRCDDGQAASPRVTVSGAVNTQVPGTYALTYVARDTAGNTSQVTRNVTVTPSDACAATPAGWTATGSMAQQRMSHSATLLADGRVLVAGGFTTSVELYDSAARTFSATGSNLTTHRGHTATRLNNGYVLVAGGTTSTTRSSAELYVPEQGKWLTTGRLTSVRFNHAAVLLPDGRVLAVGGFDKESSGVAQASAELYDPATGTWSATGAMQQGRGFHTLTLLSNGKVLVTGGSLQPDHNAEGNTLVAGAELYDPATGTWSSAGTMSTGRAWHTASLLADGKVLVVGGAGVNAALSASTELYNPATGTWSTTGAMKSPRRWHSATVLPNGEVLVAGGYHQSTGILLAAERYHPATGQWSVTATMNTDRYRYAAVLLKNGTVLAVGGASNRDQAAAETYQP